MKRIALATCAAWPELTQDDRLLIPALQQFDVEAVAAVWDEPLDWIQFDQVVIRSCWDYHLRHEEFLDWIERLERSGVTVQNPPGLIRWNSDKRYLRELSAAGATIPPTVWVDDGGDVSVHEILDEKGWTSAIVKPAVSASAHNLRRVFKDDPAAGVKGPALIQRFMPEIVSTGEWSLVFRGRQYSHAVLKRAAAGNFLVQSEFGGTATLARPREEIVSEATRIIG